MITLKRSKNFDIKSGSCMTFLVTSTTFRPDWPRSSLKTVPVMKKHGPPPSLEAPLISARSSQAVGSQAVDMRQAVGLHQCGCVVFINVDVDTFVFINVAGDLPPTYQGLHSIHQENNTPHRLEAAT